MVQDGMIQDGMMIRIRNKTLGPSPQCLPPYTTDYGPWQETLAERREFLPVQEMQSFCSQMLKAALHGLCIWVAK